MILRTTRAGLGPVFASRIIRPSLSHAVRPPAWRTYSVKAPNPGRQAPAASGAQGAQMSASSKHPFDTGEPRIPRGALKDPAAGPNSRPADMEPSLTQSPSAGPSAPSPQSSGSSVRTSTGATTSTPGSATTAASAQAQTQASIPETRDPVRGPSSSPASDLRDPVRGPSSSPVPSTPTVEIPPSPAEGVPSEATEMEETVMNPRSRHPFDTYAFVSRLERSGIDSGTARALMEGVRSLIVQRSEEARRRMLSREELDNAAYRFKAALSELRTEQSVRTRNDGIALRSAASAMRREVDGLEQQMKVDLQGLRHDIDLDLNNRKTETQAELKAFEIAKEEINNKFTISLGDLRTDIESAKWDATRRAIGIIAMLVITGIALSTFSIPAKPPPAAPAATRDIGVGTDDKLVDDHDHHDEHHDEHHVRVEEHLDAILQDRGWRERERERERTETPRERIRREKETATTREVDRDTLSRPTHYSERI